MKRADQEDRLKFWSRLIANASLGVAVAMPVLVLVGLVVNEIDLPLWAMILGVAPVALLSMGLLAARRCFCAFAKGEWFTAQPAAGLEDFGKWLTAAGVAGILVPNLIAVLLADGSISLSLSSTQILGLLFGAILWSLGSVWRKAFGLAKENEGFV